MNKAAEKMAAEQGIIVPHPEIQAVAKMSTTTENKQQQAQQPWQLQANTEPEYVDAQPDTALEEQNQQLVQNSESDGEITQTSPEPSLRAHNQKRKTPAESFAELKAEKERLARENQDMMRKLLERELYNTQAKQQQRRIDDPEEDLDVKIEDDDLVDGKAAKKLDKKRGNEINELRQRVQKYEQQLLEQRLRAQYPDFDQVVTVDNLSMLAYMRPGIAKTIDSDLNLESKAETAYEIIKSLGIYKQTTPQHEAEKKRIQENALKPKLSPAVAAQQQGESPLSKANMFAEGLTPQLKEQLKREMEQARRGY